MYSSKTFGRPDLHTRSHAVDQDLPLDSCECAQLLADLDAALPVGHLHVSVFEHHSLEVTRLALRLELLLLQTGLQLLPSGQREQIEAAIETLREDEMRGRFELQDVAMLRGDVGPPLFIDCVLVLCRGMESRGPPTSSALRVTPFDPLRADPNPQLPTGQPQTGIFGSLFFESSAHRRPRQGSATNRPLSGGEHGKRGLWVAGIRGSRPELEGSPKCGARPPGARGQSTRPV